MKRFLLKLYRQLLARKNLYHLRDARAIQPWLACTLREAAEVWPAVLPGKPRSILDVGAHRGEVAAQLACLYRPGFVGLVEPLPQLAAGLQARRLAPQQRFFPCALGRQRGTATLNVLANLPSSSLLEATPESAAAFEVPLERIGRIEVEVRTLDEVFAECGLEELDLLKIDVQGFELEVFGGGSKTLRRTRLIVGETPFFLHYHGQPLFKDIYDFLRGAGFELRGTFGWVYDQGGRPLQCDAVFINLTLTGAQPQ